jgi:hypothetical protein
MSREVPLRLCGRRSTRHPLEHRYEHLVCALLVGLATSVATRPLGGLLSRIACEAKNQACQEHVERSPCYKDQGSNCQWNGAIENER